MVVALQQALGVHLMTSRVAGVGMPRDFPIDLVNSQHFDPPVCIRKLKTVNSTLFSLSLTGRSLGVNLLHGGLDSTLKTVILSETPAAAPSPSSGKAFWLLGSYFTGALYDIGLDSVRPRQGILFREV